MDNYKIPTITVLMPVYNCALYINEAMDSILNQTFDDFEFLIIDDASTDDTVSIIKSYNDPRIQLVEKPVNTGYTNSLNYGLSIANGKYIARMDGDDISLPERFQRQYDFMEANPDVVVCGVNFSIIGTQEIVVLPQENETIKLQLLIGNCLAHPSVLMRKQGLEALSVAYNVAKEPAEDYDLWVRILGVGKLHNLQEILLKYRVHPTQVSQKRNKQQKQSVTETRVGIFKYLNCAFDDEERLILKNAIQNKDLQYHQLKSFFILKEKMILANANNFFESKGFQDYLLALYRKSVTKYFLEREKYFPLIFFQYWKIKWGSRFNLSTVDEIKLLAKSIIYFGRK